MSDRGRMVMGAMLVLVLAWALAAVVMLVLTVSNASGIEDDVDRIVNRTSEINEETEAIELADRTDEIAERIARQVQPLDRQLGRVVAVTADIDRTAGSIFQTTFSISQNAQSITGEVAQLNATVARLERVVQGIGGEALEILDTVRAIAANATSVDADVRAIRMRLEAVLATARSIDAGVLGINLNVRQVIDAVADIAPDTQRVREEVETHGDGYPRIANLRGHAHSIDCQAHQLFEPLEPQPRYCPPNDSAMRSNVGDSAANRSAGSAWNTSVNMRSSRKRK